MPAKEGLPPLRTYIIRRLLGVIPLVLGASVIIFAVMRLAPGDPVATMFFGRNRLDPAAVEKKRQELGLDKPLPVQYVIWLKNTLQGNLGESYRFQRPVADLIAQRLPNTLLLTVTAEVLAFAVAIPLGVLSAVRQYSLLDYTASTLSVIGISLPSFFAALILMYIFGVKLGWFPLGGTVTPGPGGGGILDRLWHLCLPAFTLSIRGLTAYTRYTRSQMLEVIRQDYVRTARAKGLAEAVVIYKHALRNSLIPVITLLGFSLPGLFAGAVILETIFTWPGMGLLTVEALAARDYPVIMATNVLFALLLILGNLVADILYAVVDPRIRYA